MFLFFSRISGAPPMRSTVAAGVAGVGATLLFAGLAQAQHDHGKPIATSPPTGSGASRTGAIAASATPNAAGTSMPLQFESVLSRYKPMTDQKLGSWREANDTVTRIGGWRTYLKESQAPDTAAPATTAPSTTARPVAPNAPTAPNPHAGHGAKP